MASSVKFYPPQPGAQPPNPNPLPQLIQTPSGLAILELQGTINLPPTEGDVDGNPQEIEVGRISFPDYNPNTQNPSNTSWMKCVQLYVGQHQRLTGEVKKLPKALAVIRKRESSGNDQGFTDSTADMIDDLEVMEIVKYKLVFSQRPEPVGTAPG